MNLKHKMILTAMMASGLFDSLSRERIPYEKPWKGMFASSPIYFPKRKKLKGYEKARRNK